MSRDVKESISGSKKESLSLSMKENISELHWTDHARD